MGRLAGKVALVTGGGWNVGRAVAVAFAREGARVALAGRREALIAATAEAIAAEGGEALAVPTDVTVREEVDALAARTREAFGPVDVLAAIAGGGGGYEEVDAIDPEWWEQVIRVNLVGSFLAVRAVLPGMRERGSGSILTCTGGGGWFPVVEVPATAYATAKAGICRFTDQLALELLGTGIRVNCLQPGQVWSPKRLAEVEAEERASGAAHPGRATNHPPEHAAELALWLASADSEPMTGRSVSVDEDWWRDPAQVQAVCESHHAYCLRRVGPGYSG